MRVSVSGLKRAERTPFRMPKEFPFSSQTTRSRLTSEARTSRRPSTRDRERPLRACGTADRIASRIHRLASPVGCDVLRVLHWQPSFLAGGAVANSVVDLAVAEARAGAEVVIAAADIHRTHV